MMINIYHIYIFVLWFFINIYGSNIDSIKVDVNGKNPLSSINNLSQKNYISSVAPKNNLTQLTVIIKQIKFKFRSLLNMNNHKPITLDVIVVYDTSLFSILNNLKSHEYFQSRHEIYKENKHLMSISSWDVLPGKVSQDFLLNVGPNALCIMIFAGYSNEDKNHKLIIPIHSSHIMILLNEKTLVSTDNGIDYMEIGSTQRLNVIEIKKQEKIQESDEIPNGFNKFYTLDSNKNNPPITNINNLYEPLTITKTNNEPLRLESLKPLKSNFLIENKKFIVPIYNSWGHCLWDLLKEDLFSNQGIIDNNILNNHGIVTLQTYDCNQNNCNSIISVFKKKHYFYLELFSKFYHNIAYGRSNPLEQKKITTVNILPDHTINQKNNSNNTSLLQDSANSSNNTNSTIAQNNNITNNPNNKNNSKVNQNQPNNNNEDNQKNTNKQNSSQDKNDKNNQDNSGVTNNKEEKNNQDLNGQGLNTVNNKDLDSENNQSPNNNENNNSENIQSDNINDENNNQNPNNSQDIVDSPMDNPLNSSNMDIPSINKAMGNLSAKARWLSLLDKASTGAKEVKNVGVSYL